MKAIKQNIHLILAPLLVLIVIMEICVNGEIYPFGELSLLWGDMAEQNLPILLEIRSILLGESGSLFSMQNASGMDFFGIFLFLGSSPFSLLTVFVEKSDMAYFLTYMITAKIMLSAITAGIYFKYSFKKLNTIQLTTLCVAYALSGYSLMYYQLHTWLDVMYMFPLLLVGIKRIYEGKRITLYVVSLFCIVLFQFYLVYMVALFIIFSVSIFTWLNRKNPMKTELIRLISATIIAVLLSAFIWICALGQYIGSARSGGIIENLMNPNLFSHLDTTLPMILTSAIIIASFVFVIITRPKLKSSEKTILIMFVLMLIPIFLMPINKMWHTGSYQAFPVRYGYIPILLGLTITAIVLTRLNDNYRIARGNATKKQLTLIAIPSAVVVCLLFLFIKEFLDKNKEILKNYTSSLWSSPLTTTYLLQVFLVVFSIVLIFIIAFKFKLVSKNTFTLVILMITLTEAYFNTTVYVGFAGRNTSNYIAYTELSDKVTDDDFFRMKTYSRYINANTLGSLGYPSSAHYTSLINKDYYFAMKKLGYAAYWMEVNSSGSTAFTDALFANNYTVFNKSQIDNSFNPIFTGSRYSIVKNDIQGSAALVLDEQQKNALSTIPFSNERTSNQEYLMQTILGESYITRYYPKHCNGATLQKIDDTYYYEKQKMIGNLEYVIEVGDKKTLYFDIFRDATNNIKEPITGNMDIYVDGRLLSSDYPQYRSSGAIRLGTFENETVLVTIALKTDGLAYTFGVYGTDDNKIKDKFDELQKVNLEVDKNTLSLSANAVGDGQFLCLTVPYNDGFKITNNRKEIQPQKYLDAFMALELEDGQNDIVIKYRTPGLSIGIVISLIGLVVFAFSLFLYKKNYAARLEKIYNPLSICVYAAGGLCFVLVYVIPMVLFSIGFIRFVS